MRNDKERINNIGKANPMTHPLDTVRRALETPAQMADADLMFCINGAEDLDHLPYYTVKKIAERVCRVISQRNAEALAALDALESQPSPEGGEICPDCGAEMILSCSGLEAMAHDNRIAKLLADNARLTSALTGLVGVLEKNGEWDEGCFFYNRYSASEFQQPLLDAKQALKDGAK